MNFFHRQFIGPQIFMDTIILDKTFFGPNFFGQICFGSQIFSDKEFSWSLNIFLHKCFSDPRFILAHDFLGHEHFYIKFFFETHAVVF